MKSSHNKISYSSIVKYGGSQSQVIITLDETLEAPLLLRKFRYLTTGLQLFLQHIPVLYWNPQDVVADGGVSPSIFSAAVRNPLHKYSTEEILEESVKKITSHNCSPIINQINELKTRNVCERHEILKSLLLSLFDCELFILQQPPDFLSDPFRYASERLKDDETFVLKAVKKKGFHLQHVSDRLKKNDLIISEAIKQDGRVLCILPNGFAKNEKIVLQALKSNGLALEYAASRFRNNELFVLEAIKQNCRAIEYASERLRKDLNFKSKIMEYCKSRNIFKVPGFSGSEFICKYMENHQSHFHELTKQNK